jgi:hypothetical protein
LSQHIKYFYDLGISKPSLESRILFNQVKFADSCNFNNIYVYSVPKLEKITSLSTRANYINAAQKNLIINNVNRTKLATAEIVFNDPVYVQLDLGLRLANEPLTPEISNSCYLQITRDLTSKRNPETIRQLVANIIINYFATTKDNLGKLISLTDLSSEINAINGIINVKTIRIDGTTTHTTPGINFLAFNPVYPYDDINIISQDTQLPFFKFPYLNNPVNFIDKITVITPSLQLLEREF